MFAACNASQLRQPRPDGKILWPCPVNPTRAQSTLMKRAFLPPDVPVPGPSELATLGKHSMRSFFSYLVLGIAGFLFPACATTATQAVAAGSAPLFRVSPPPHTSTPDSPDRREFGAPGGAAADFVHVSMPNDSSSADAAQADEWRFAIAPYLWAVSMDGDVTVKGNKAEVDLSFDEIFKKLDVGVLIAAEARQGDMVYQLDQTYLALSDDEKAGGVRVDADIAMYLGTLKMGHYVADGPEAPMVFVGARYWHLDMDVEAKAGGATIARSKGDQDWWDALVGVEKRWILDDRWSVVGKGLVGGFGLGDASDTMWDATVLATRQSDAGNTFAVGWRHLVVDKDRGSGAKKFELDANISGPIIGWAFRF
jgi:hypothetical protein